MIWRTTAKTSFGEFRPFLGFISKEPFTQGELRECYLLWITQDQGETSGVRWVAQNAVNGGGPQQPQQQPHQAHFGYQQPGRGGEGGGAAATSTGTGSERGSGGGKGRGSGGAGGKSRLFVAKRFLTLDGKDELSLLKEDLFLQYKAKEISAAYNQQNPPKPVDFVDCGIFLLRRAQGRREELFLVEPFLEGDYVKYSNNAGWESGDRATPLAFSHFSYDYSRGNLVVVDMQGVGNTYTDPGVHTRDEWWEQCDLQSSTRIVPRLGPANFGDEGIQVFRTTHRCHPLCEELRLTVVNKLTKLKRVTTSNALFKEQAEAAGRRGGRTRNDDAEDDDAEELETLLFGSSKSDGGDSRGWW